jgi:hypothetical protein
MLGYKKMVGSIERYAAAAALIVLAGCASPPQTQYQPRHAFRPPIASTEAGSPLQCVPYAREHSSVKLYGDAYTWWDKAGGRYRRGFTPVEGSVMVLYNYAGPNHAHVAVVRNIVGAREIRVDHANWLSNGAIYENNPVYDISPNNDWSVVRVFNIPADRPGVRQYPVQGFIGPGRAGEGGEMPADDPLAALIASLDDDSSPYPADESGAGWGTGGD